MSKKMEISDQVFERLQHLAVPLVDTPETIVQRLLDHYESQASGGSRFDISGVVDHTGGQKSIKRPLPREPRQRGVEIKMGDTLISASSVSELYVKVLENLYQSGHLDKLKPYLPLATSKRRYLIARSPVHPSGKGFVVPVEYNGYYMEAHKDYKNGICHLRKMLSRCGVTLTYLG